MQATETAQLPEQAADYRPVVGGPWTPRTVLRRFVQVARDDGMAFLWFKVWGELVYRRLGLFELCLDDSLPDVEAEVPIVVGEWTASDDAAVDGAEAVPTVARDELLRRRQAGHRCFVVHRDGELVGSCWMARGSMPSSYLRTDIALGPDEACSYETYTAPSARGLGIGPALRAEAARMLRDDGCRRLLATISLENPPAIRLVEKLGYELIGRIGYLGRGPVRWDFCRVASGASGLAQTRRSRSARVPVRARATGFLRNLPRLRRRLGTRGILELLAARGLPSVISYQRVTLIETPGSGDELHPELRPRRHHRSDAAIEDFHARLVAAGEPEVPAFSAEELQARFAAGHELWTFEVEGTLAHARWTVSDCLRFAGFSVPLVPGEHVTEAILTLPRFRRHGLNVTARAHVRAALGAEGATRMLSAINGFNQRFLRSTLGITGARPRGGGARPVAGAPALVPGGGLLGGRDPAGPRWAEGRTLDAQV